ncbi:hypothetical protein H4R27_002634 [Coemansia aciculifera]|nr:hypothetical protein H4R27_002634 [Coemansia aciculifera]
MPTPTVAVSPHTAIVKPPPFTFQTLPMPIVYEVVEYLEGYYKYSFNIHTSRHIASKAILAPLLSVSERWRKAALESICDSCVLDFNHSCETREVVFPAWPTDVPPSWLYMLHLVKLIFVSATLEKILSDGVFCSTLTWLQSESVVLPAARTLILHLKNVADLDLGFDDSLRHTSEGETVVVNFARRLKQLAPAATDLHLFIPSIDETQANNRLLCGLLISTLCQAGIKGVHVYAEQATIPVSLDVQGLSRLTRITQGKNVACGPFARLAYHNANTLQMLNINVGAEDDWLSLVYGGTKVLATFNSLDELIITATDVPYEATWTAIDNAAPFPVLWMLEVFDRYPFDDDMLFRGNGKTMKYLCIPFCALARHALGRFDVFRRSGVLQMNSVRIGPIFDADEAFVTERGDAPVKQQLRHILKASAALFISDDTSEMSLCETIETAPSTHDLQHMDLGEQVYYVCGVIDLLTALPGLVSLTCLVGSPDEDIEANPGISCLGCFRKRYYPLSKRFKVLRVRHTDESSVEEIAYVAMHIAVVCPSFAFVDLPLEHRKEFSQEIARAMANRPFRPFADSIRHLMFKE